MNAAGKFVIVVGAIIAGFSVWGAMDSIPKPSTVPAVEDEQSSARYDAEWAAIEACRTTALGNARYPSKADFHAAVDALSDDSVNWTVIGMVDLMNDVGAMIPHRYACLVRGSTVVSDTLGP